MDQIRIRGLRELAVIGVLPEEQVRAQPIEIDVDLDVDLRAAGVSDDLDDTSTGNSSKANHHRPRASWG